MLLASVLALSVLTSTLALDGSMDNEGFSIPFTKRSAHSNLKRDETADERISRLTAGVRSAHFKYGATPNAMMRKRQSKGNVQIADVDGDV